MIKYLSIFATTFLLFGCAQLQTKNMHQTQKRLPSNEDSSLSAESQNYCNAHAQTHYNRPRNADLLRECLSIYEMGTQYQNSINNNTGIPNMAVSFCHATFPIEESAYENATEHTRILIDQILRSRRYCLAGALKALN